MPYERLKFIELTTIPSLAYDRVMEWNKRDDRITILTLEALSTYVMKTVSNPSSGVVAAIYDNAHFLGLSWTLRLRGEWRSATIIDRSIRGKGYGSVLFNMKVALFKDKVGEEFPEVTLDPNNKPSYNMVQSSGVKMKFNPDRKEI